VQHSFVPPPAAFIGVGFTTLFIEPQGLCIRCPFERSIFHDDLGGRKTQELPPCLCAPDDTLGSTSEADFIAALDQQIQVLRAQGDDGFRFIHGLAPNGGVQVQSTECPDEASTFETQVQA
jgi:hypothetical protein